METPNKELAQLLISGKRKTIRAKNLKHATAIRVAGHRLGYVLTVTQEGREINLVYSGRPVVARKADAAVVARKAAVRSVAPTRKGRKPKTRKGVSNASVLD